MKDGASANLSYNVRILPLCSAAGYAESVSQQPLRLSLWTDVSGWEIGRDVENVASRLIGVMDSSNHAMRDRDSVDVRIAPGRSAGTVTSSVYIPGVSLTSLVGFCAKPESERIVTMAELGASDCSVQSITSEVVLRQDGMVSWDCGWDDAGNHILGASTGGYQFKKINPAEVDVIVNSAAARLSGRFDNSAQVGEDGDFALGE